MYICSIYLWYFSTISDFTFCVITRKIMETVSYLFAFNQSPFEAMHLLSLGRRLPTCTRCEPSFSIALKPSCKWKSPDEGSQISLCSIIDTVMQLVKNLKVIELYTCDRFRAGCQVYKLPQARINKLQKIMYSHTFYTVAVVLWDYSKHLK